MPRGEARRGFLGLPYEIVEEQNGFVVRYSGFLPPQEALATIRHVHEHPKSGRDCYMLCDFRAVDGQSVFIMSISDPAEVAQRVRAILGGGRGRLLIAVVAQVPAVRDFIQAVRDHGAHPSQHRFGFFETEEAARRWIAAEMAAPG